jgi:hypothetical protein
MTAEKQINSASASAPRSLPRSGFGSSRVARSRNGEPGHRLCERAEPPGGAGERRPAPGGAPEEPHRQPRRERGEQEERRLLEHEDHPRHEKRVHREEQGACRRPESGGGELEKKEERDPDGGACASDWKTAEESAEELPVTRNHPPSDAGKRGGRYTAGAVPSIVNPSPAAMFRARARYSAASFSTSGNGNAVAKRRAERSAVAESAAAQNTRPGHLRPPELPVVVCGRPGMIEEYIPLRDSRAARYAGQESAGEASLEHGIVALDRRPSLTMVQQSPAIRPTPIAVPE